MAARLGWTALLREAFDANGLAGPVPVLTGADCRKIARALRGERAPAPATWRKATAVQSRTVYDVATRRAALDAVSALVGDDVMLWGARVVRRAPGFEHPWHSDIESSGLGRRSVTVWIGIEHTGNHAPLSLVGRSHALGAPLQQVAAENGVRRGEADADTVLAWALERDPEAALVAPVLEDGDALLFDGRIWHASQNLNRWRERTAVVLQYAAPDAAIRIPEYGTYEWPFRFREEPRPPCVMVRGCDRHEANWMVPGPPDDEGAKPVLATGVHPLPLPLERDEAAGRRSHSLFRGATPNLRALACHATVLEAGCCPHPPHRHAEEELLLLLDGEAEIIGVETGDAGGRERARTLNAGAGVYHPAGSYHTIRNSGERPATYLMFKWRADATGGEGALATAFFDFREPAPRSPDRGHTTRVVFDGPTGALHRLQCHVSRIEPGAGYRPHVDAHDVALVVCAGEVETLGATVKPHGVAFAAGGHLHGMQNTGDATAHYVVFEFHKGDARIAPPLRTRVRRRLRRLAGRVPRLDRFLRHRGRNFRS